MGGVAENHERVLLWGAVFDGVACHIPWFYRGDEEPLPLADPQQQILAAALLRHDEMSDGHDGVYQTCQLSLKKESHGSGQLTGL
ncbi:hypothetical protein DSG91_05415 [Salmonella enterica subsp. enterica]|nr:hypothetical protein [Salmonella enterica subsp. enterica serovar Napoli]